MHATKGIKIGACLAFSQMLQLGDTIKLWGGVAYWLHIDNTCRYRAHIQTLRLIQIRFLKSYYFASAACYACSQIYRHLQLMQHQIVHQALMTYTINDVNHLRTFQLTQT